MLSCFQLLEVIAKLSWQKQKELIGLCNASNPVPKRSFGAYGDAIFPKTASTSIPRITWQLQRECMIPGRDANA